MESYEIVKKYELQAVDQQDALKKLEDMEVLGHQFLVENGVYVRKAPTPLVQAVTTQEGYERIFANR